MWRTVGSICIEECWKIMQEEQRSMKKKKSMILFCKTIFVSWSDAIYLDCNTVLSQVKSLKIVKKSGDPNGCWFKDPSEGSNKVNNI